MREIPRIPRNLFKGALPLYPGIVVKNQLTPVNSFSLTCSKVNYDRILNAASVSEGRFSKILSSFDNTLTYSKVW